MDVLTLKYTPMGRMPSLSFTAHKPLHASPGDKLRLQCLDATYAL
jgi:hypothetical protein